MKPLVGVTAWKRSLNTYLGPEMLHTLSYFYVDALTEAGCSPLIFPSAGDPADAERFVSLVDGVVLSGGGDVDPASYGQENSHSSGNHPEVDRFEVAVIEEAQRQAKPVLAICRGLQILNVALGGTLEQEITAPGAVHDTVNNDPDDMNSRRHVVTFEEGSRMAEIYGSTEAKVNTLHHQGVSDLAEGLVAEGWTDDGLIEAARHDSDWWVTAVQWHPERMEGHHRKLFDSFLGELKTQD